MLLLTCLAATLPLAGALPRLSPRLPQANAPAATFEADIRVDTNRDGIVDVDGTSDVSGKDTWSETSGAIFLPNIGNTEQHCSAVDCSDASGSVQWAPGYMAPMRTVPMTDISDSATATIAIHDPVAREKVRIFLDSPEMLDKKTVSRSLARAAKDQPPPPGSERYVLIANDTPIPAEKLRQGLVLGVDATDTRRPNGWDGRVTVEFTVTDGSMSSSDKVMLRVAPVLTHHHLQPIDEVFSTTKEKRQGIDKIHAWATTSTENINAAIEQSMQKAGIEKPLGHLNIDFTFAQDVMEPGYASMPGPSGPISIRINLYGLVLQSGRRDKSRRLLYTDLRREGIGAVTPNPDPDAVFNRLEAGGNIESTPPFENNGKKYPAGRIVIGGTDAAKPVVLSYLAAQETQDPVLLDATWTAVGHVDEIVSFLPAKTERGWRIAVLDPKMGYDVLVGLDNNGHGNTSLISHPEKEHSSSHVPTVHQFLDDASAKEAAERAAEKMARNVETLKQETGITDQDIIRLPGVVVPVSTWDKYLRLVWENANEAKVVDGFEVVDSVFPSQVNSVPLSDSLVMVPKPWGPVVDGEDMMQKASAEAFSRAGLQVDFIDEWALHKSSGDLHCFTNTYRAMTQWW